MNWHQSQFIQIVSKGKILNPINGNLQVDMGNRTKVQALLLTRKPSLHVVNNSKDIKAVACEAFKFVLPLLSSFGDEESSGQDQEQEGGDEDEVEEDN
jgi:hypothetical protein